LCKDFDGLGPNSLANNQAHEITKSDSIIEIYSIQNNFASVNTQNVNSFDFCNDNLFEFYNDLNRFEFDFNVNDIMCCIKFKYLYKIVDNCSVCKYLLSSVLLFINFITRLAI
jgi:hypothetical protein